MKSKLFKDSIISDAVRFGKDLSIDRTFPKTEEERFVSIGDYNICKFPKASASKHLPEHKNFEIIPKTIEVLKSRGVTNVKFVVTLPKEQFKEAFGDNPSSNIINVGFVPTLEGASLYKECDFMFLPTLLECFSASYAEAMVMKKPILTSDLGFAHTVCKDAAVYFDPDDAYDVADKIIRLINSPEQQAELVSMGTEQLSQFGSAQQRAIKILELCKEITK